MEISKYISRMKEFYGCFLNFVESDNDSPDYFQEFITNIKNNKFGESPDELRSILHIISKIFNHHKRDSSFIDKIHNIILFYSDQIKQNFSNFDLFRIFKNNKLLLIFLFAQKIIKVDENIAIAIYKKYGNTGSNFFYPEIKPFMSKNDKKIVILKDPNVMNSNFETNRQKGENDSKICELIRNDSIDEFMTFVKEKKVALSHPIPKSIYETHSFLIKHDKSSLIEYAAFFGSIKIFQFLYQQKVNLPSSLWICAIHSKNIELIHLLEEYKVKPEFISFDSCFTESMKCHHNEIVNYIRSNYINKKEEIDFFYNYSNYYNFEFFPDELTGDIEKIFDTACQHDYSTIVKIFLSNGEINLRELLNRKSVFKKRKFLKFQTFFNDILYDFYYK